MRELLSSNFCVPIKVCGRHKYKNLRTSKLSILSGLSKKDRGVSRSYTWLVGCRFESNFPLVGHGTIGGVPSVGVFLRDPSPYLCEFQGKTRKTPKS